MWRIYIEAILEGEWNAARGWQPNVGILTLLQLFCLFLNKPSFSPTTYKILFVLATFWGLVYSPEKKKL